jgi:hypothetical protein
MRTALIATMSALATLAAISIASAADNKPVKAPQPDVTATAAPAEAPYGGLYSEGARCDSLSALHRREGLEEWKACLR